MLFTISSNFHFPYQSPIKVVSVLDQTKHWIKGSLVNFFCEAKSVSKKDALI